MTDQRVSERDREKAAGGDERHRCPECGEGLITDESNGERVCRSCGLVSEEALVDHGPEWRAFDAAEREQRSRVGAPVTPSIHDKGLSTKIGWDDRDAHGRTIDGKKRERMRRLRTWNERFRSTDARDRNLKHALGEISRMASALGLPDPIRETASVIYRRALSEDLLPGRSIEGMATAALYAAARVEEAARSVDEVVAVSRVGSLEVKRTYRYLVDELGLTVPPTHPVEYVGRFASKLDCADETERRARELIEAATEEGLHSGRDPTGIAASAMYAAGRLTNEELTQTEVSAATNISEVTIRNRYVEILEAVEAGPGPA